LIRNDALITINSVCVRTCTNPGCDAAVLKETIKPVVIGAGLRLHADCTIGHNLTWKSCEFVNKGRTSILDVMISVFQLSIGLNMSQVTIFFLLQYHSVLCIIYFFVFKLIWLGPLLYFGRIRLVII
jgi:hypothetical protein